MGFVTGGPPSSAGASGRVRMFLGIFTTVVFVGVGGLLIAEQRYVLGAVSLSLGIVRGILVIRQAWAG